jgi:hypothetical protein
MGKDFTKPLPSKKRGIRIQTHRLMGFRRYAVQMGLGVKLHILTFITICSGVQKLWGGDRDTQPYRQQENNNNMVII